jgi:hypothetical protein
MTITDVRRIETQEMLGGDVDIKEIVLDVVKDHHADFDVRFSVTDARVKETMSGAPTLEVDVHDPDWRLLKSDVLFEEDKDGDRVVRKVWIELEKDRWYELAQVKFVPADTGRGTDLTLVFEHRIVADLRKHRKPKKVSRKKMTRAEFVQTFAREVKLDKIRFISPELHVKQPLAPLDFNSKQSEKDVHRKPGFGKHAHIEVQGSAADASQKKVLAEILDEGERQGASRKVLIVAMMVVAQESAAKPSATNGIHVGPFQQDPNWQKSEADRRNPTKSARKFFKKAIEIDQASPHIQYATLAEDVQHSGQPEYYAQWKKEATNTVKEYGGSGAEAGRTRYKAYLFSRGIDGKHEDSWTCSQRLAQEVNWRSFVSGKVNWYFISEPDLFKSRPRLNISQDNPAILSVTGDIDRGKSANTLTVEVRMALWTAPAGSVVTVEGYGMDGRWLVDEVERSLFSRNGTVTVKKPTKPEPEPRPDTIYEAGSSGGASGALGTVARDDKECRGVKLKPILVEFLQLVSGQWGKTVHVTTSTCHNKFTQDGNISDHWDGNATDLGSVANKFAIGGKGGDDLAVAAFRVAGVTNRAKALEYASTAKRVNWSHKGITYSVQILWKYPGHFDHVHVGIRLAG